MNFYMKSVNKDSGVHLYSFSFHAKNDNIYMPDYTDNINVNYRLTSLKYYLVRETAGC